MTKIKLNTGIELDAEYVLKSNKYSNGTNRDCLEMMFDAKTYDINELIETFKNESNLGEIILFDEAENGFIHTDYAILDSISYRHEGVDNHAEKLSVTLCRHTASEKIALEQALAYSKLIERIERLEGAK